MESFIQRLVKLGPSALSAVGIVREAVRATADVRDPAERRQKIEHMVRCLAAGADGVSGTEDDLLSREAVDQLVKLLHMGIVGDIADELMKALAAIPPLRLPSLKCFRC
jgi:hypothetical protein